jgi:hypothetical protein
VFKISEFLRVAQTALEEKILNTHLLLCSCTLPSSCNIDEHDLRESQEGIKAETVRPR